MFGLGYKRVQLSGGAFLGLEGQMVGKIWGQDYVTDTLNTMDSSSTIQKTNFTSSIVPLNLTNGSNPSVCVKTQSL